MKKCLFVIMVIFTVLSFSACEDEYTEVQFKINCSGDTSDGSFWGYYSIDGGEDQYFSDIDVRDSNTQEYISPVLEDFSYLEIYVERDHYDSTLRVRLYEEDVKVLSKTLSADDDEDDSSTDHIEMDYEYEEYLDDDDSSE